MQTLPLGEKVQALAFSPDGRLLAVGLLGRDGAANLRMIDVKSMKLVYETNPDLGEVLSLAWADRSDARYLAACGDAGVALWKVSRDSTFRMEEALKLDRKRCLATVLNKEGSVLVWVQDDCNLQAWDVAAARQKKLTAPPMLHGWHGVVFLPDGQSIIYISKSGVAEIWNVKDDHRVVSVGEPATFNAEHIAPESRRKMVCRAAQPDTVSVWRLPSGKYEFSLRPEISAIWSLAWDPSSEHLAVGQSDGGLAIWHLAKIQKKLIESGLPWKDED